MKTLRLTMVDAAAVTAAVVLILLLLLPAGLRAGKYGMEAMCLANVRGLLRAWTLYHEDNDGSLVGGSTYYYGGRVTPYRWVERPLYKDTDNPGPPPEGKNSMVPSDFELTQEYRLNGIRAGKLFPYTENVALYHCPADRTLVSNPEPYAVYRSYSISGTMSGEEGATGYTRYVVGAPSSEQKQVKAAFRAGDIASPSEKYVFVEEEVVRTSVHLEQPYNLGSFIIFAQNNYWSWWDVPADYHRDGSALGFADGHAVIRRWQDPRTLASIKGVPIPPATTPPDRRQPDNADLAYLAQGYFPCE